MPAHLGFVALSPHSGRDMFTRLTNQAQTERDWKLHLPGYSAGFHVICNDNIIRPDVKMPFLVAQYAAHHRAAVDADAHVEVNLQN